MLYTSVFNFFLNKYTLPFINKKYNYFILSRIKEVLEANNSYVFFKIKYKF